MMYHMHEQAHFAEQLSPFSHGCTGWINVIILTLSQEQQHILVLHTPFFPSKLNRYSISTTAIQFENSRHRQHKH